ncbi:hypothetical protein [Microbacterium sp. 179-I 3D4 NHS]|uniref:hypothetical protein n=1 Tax=Microbacterium sp. 179-I 3D4 NHS TaxID=3142381 RepID=UPI0039A3F7C8
MGGNAVDSDRADGNALRALRRSVFLTVVTALAYFGATLLMLTVSVALWEPSIATVWDQPQILAVFNVTPRLTWIRTVGGAAIANGVLLPFGYAVLAPLSFDCLRGAIWLGALVIGSLVVHPLALLIEQATASRAAGRRRPAPGRVS